jgi:NTE family protein
MLWRLRPPVLALGGGGARGFAHIGVLEVLQQHGLKIRAIAGTSMGAVLGAMYLHEGSTKAVLEKWREVLAAGIIPTVRPIGSNSEAGAREHPLIQAARRFRDRVVVSMAMNRSTVIDDSALKATLEALVPDVDLGDLPRQLVVVATDLETGEEIRLREGRLRSLLKASSSIPGLVPAEEHDGRQLVDGGVVAEVPVGAARELGRPVIAVDASMELPSFQSPGIVLDTIMRTQMMTAALLRNKQLAKADHVIRPQVGDATWADWDRLDALVESGRLAAREWLGL